MRVAIFGNVYQEEKSKHIVQVISSLLQLGGEVCLEAGFKQFLQGTAVSEQIELSSIESFEAHHFVAELAISRGGDGTFLNTVEKLGRANIPILGVNTGRLGFLAEVNPLQAQHIMQQLLAGPYHLKELSLLQVEVEGHQMEVYPYALNEVAVLKHDNSSLIEVQTRVDHSLMNNCLADGLILCTPTGSTGYSLSTGGPVIDPQSATFCLSPVAPHSLTMRPVVLRDDVVVEWQIRSRSGNFLLAVDGRSQTFPSGAKVRLRKADYKVKVVKMPEQNFFMMLRDKMMWGIDQRQ